MPEVRRPTSRPPPASGRSMLGVQHDSRKASAPVFGFGSADRNALARVFISVDHCRADFGKLGPGAVYDMKSGFGTQNSSKNANPPKFSFGTASRFLQPSAARARRNPQVPGPGSYAAPSSIGRSMDSNAINQAAFGFGTATRDDAQRVFISAAAAKVRFGMESPGPAAYANSATQNGVGAQPLSTRRTEPAFSVGAEKRLVYDYVERAKRLPGAGQYPAADSVGVQTLSYRETEPEFGFGTSTRDGANRVFLGKEQSKVFFGRESPGPAALGPTAFGGTGRMVQSTKSTAPVATFGNAGRAGGRGAQTPGPGSYD